MDLPILLAAPEGEGSRIVHREEAGLCVPAEDPQRLVPAVLFLKENRLRLNQFSKRSCEAAPHYSRERQARDMLAALHAAVSEKRALPVSARPDEVNLATSSSTRRRL